MPAYKSTAFVTYSSLTAEGILFVQLLNGI